MVQVIRVTHILQSQSGFIIELKMSDEDTVTCLLQSPGATLIHGFEQHQSSNLLSEEC